MAVLLYSYAVGERSARRVERRCVEDVAFRVLAGNLAPDHVTICRFRSEHQDAIAGLFGQVLALCAKAGMVSVGTIAVDGTRMAANASRDATVGYERLRARSSRRPLRLTRLRMSSSASGVVTSCLSS